MSKPRAFLTAILVLTAASIAEADLILTVNGLDTASIPEIPCKGNLMIAVMGQTDAKVQDISVTSDVGKLKPLIVAGAPAKEQVPGEYELTFSDEGAVARVSLKAGAEVVYQLVIFYVPETGSAVVFGLDKEALAPPQPKPELELQAQSKQQISALQTAEPEKSYSASSSGGGTTQIDSFPEPNSYPDFNGDKIVNFIDFAIFAKNWKKSGSGLDGDFDDSGTVDANDLRTFAYFWLNGPHPLDVFESFKTALATADVNEALAFVAEISRDKYAEIFQIIEPNLSDYAAGMGEMTFDRQRFGEVIYEMLHDDDGLTLSFPVFFIREQDGVWRIFNL